MPTLVSDLEPGAWVEFKPAHAQLGGWRPGTVTEIERDGLGRVVSVTVKPASGTLQILAPSRVRASGLKADPPAKPLPPMPRQAWPQALDTGSAPSPRPIALREPPSRSADYLAHVRARPCTGCAAQGPNDAHHFGPRGMGQKTDDYRTLPLCRACHDLWHQTGRLPGCADRVASERAAYKAQVDAMTAWLRRIG